MTKFIIVTGGVVSSLGKGIVSASIGMLLKQHGLRVTMLKFDPYINVDAGTMNPYQHGEVFVTDDGGETDLDLGHYERFIDVPMTKASNVTSGMVYNSVISQERKGTFDGACVQVVPHITDEIKRRIYLLAGDDIDVVIVEVGGTVGDIESQPFLEALRQFRIEVKSENIAFLHLTLIPYLSAAGELKTKPSQHSVMKLREIGIQPDALLVRTQLKTTKDVRAKLSLFCSVDEEHVIEVPDVDYSIYQVPQILHNQKLDKILVERLGLKTQKLDLRLWEDMLYKLRNPQKSVTIGVVGKYIELKDAYKSIYESLGHGGIANNISINIKRISSDTQLESEASKIIQELDNVDGILIPGGFGHRGIEGKIYAVKYARENNIPLFGICLGLQCMVIEFARNIIGYKDANSSEFNKDTSSPVIHLMVEQETIKIIGGTMRLGAYDCDIEKDSLAFAAYQQEKISERHRHRYELNHVYEQDFIKHGMKLSGRNPQTKLVEIVELPSHPWFIGVQFHPEFQSRPTIAHPLFRSFIEASSNYRKSKA